MREWRLLDTGVKTAAENMAVDDVVLAARSGGRAPSTLRFLRFSPPAALVGVCQRVEEELRLDYCEEAGVEINRRLTGGGAIYFDETQLGWEVIGSADDVGGLPSTDLFERLCAPVVAALRSLGLDAGFRPRNDIEVEGRKISGTGGTAEGNAFLFQGTLLTGFDVETMLRVLRVPVEKLKRKETDSLRERVTCLAWELGYVPPLAGLKRVLADAFGVRLVPGALTPWERELGLEVRTITSFEHLMESLAETKARGVPAFVGSCCEAFYLKHRADMERHGVPGALVDVGSDTCYDLGKTREAYAGSFESVTTVRLPLLEGVVRACAARAVWTPGGRSG